MRFFLGRAICIGALSIFISLFGKHSGKDNLFLFAARPHSQKQLTQPKINDESLSSNSKLQPYWIMLFTLFDSGQIPVYDKELGAIPKASTYRRGDSKLQGVFGVELWLLYNLRFD